MHSFEIVLQICIASILIPLQVQVNGGFGCLSNPCVHGVCLDDLNTTYSCYCIDGYTGVQCQTNWDECWSSPCQNGGLCLDGIASFNCSCPAGFTGDVCEEDFNECESNPCFNNGTCVDGSNGYTCLCLPGYSGTHCELDVAVCNATNETRCSNGGICIEGPGATFSCNCQPGWIGYLCDAELDECMSEPCQNGAICIDLHADYACACLFGFTGRNCEEIVLVCEDNPCENDALCLMEEDHPICYCVPDYHGEKCQFQYDECQLGPRCMNGGTCIDGVDNFTCSCPPNLTGVLCECLIVDDHYLDCTYISPTPIYPITKPTDGTTEISTKTSTDITSSSSTTESTTLSTLSTYPEIITTTGQTTTEVPNFITNATEVFTVLTTESTITTEKLSSEVSFTTKTTDSSTYSANITETTTEITSTEFLTTEPTTLSESTFTTIPPTTYSNFTTETIIPTKFLTTITDFLNTTTEEITSTQYTTTELQLITQNGSSQFTTITPHEISTESNTPSMGTNATSKTDVTTPTPTPTPTFITSTIITTEMIDITTFVATVTPTELSTSELTITSHEFTEVPNLPDCSIKGHRCLNGGSCMFTSEGYRCVCLFDADGPFCEHRLGIKNAAFAGDSFLSHKLMDKSRMAIDFKSKTTANTGLIFYSNIDQTYMALYIENGYLKFKFSCGYQTMLLSELGKSINNGYEMSISAELSFTRDFTHCNASIKLNNTLSMSGDQIALFDKFSKINSWLYLGGIPNEYIKDKIQPGFVGCMSNLRIQGKKVDIFKDAEDGFEVSECSSLACLSNPCQNSGICSSSGDSWSCQCKNGFSGKTCDITTCENNPCLFGGTCLPHTGSGYICLCPFGKHGHFCENELLISTPYFSSSIHGFSSYVAYPIPKGRFNRMEIKFKFSPATMDQISILMFVGQKGKHDYHSDHMAVSFVKGYIMLTWNLGSGPRRIFTTKPIQAGKTSYVVHVGRLGRRSWLYVDNLGNVTGRSPGNLVQLDVIPQIYFGGYYTQNFSNLPHDLPLHVGFSGCIFDIEFRAGDIILPLEASSQAVGRALGQCGTTECHDKICQNDGACLYHGGTFTCLCQDGYYGPLCSSRYNPCDHFKNSCNGGSTCVPKIAGYECDCSIGKTGKYCEKDEQLTDISFSGIRSFLSLAPNDFELVKFNIEFELRPLRNKGIILFVGRMDMFLSVSILSGLLELRIMPGRKRLHSNELLNIRSNKLVVLGNWHTVRVGLYGRKVYLFVNSIVNTGILQTGEVVSLADEDIFIGGLPDLSVLPREATSFLPVPYVGCIRKLFINNKHIPLNTDSIKSARNIGDCDGTPCGGDFCENSGTCWLDPNLKPHCSCPEPFFGDKCENVTTCGEKSCQNQGRCSGGKCACTVGWHGAFCEQTIVVRTPKFQGNSYLLVNRVHKKRAASNLKSISLNFTSAAEEGVILWAQKGNRFIGIGLEQGLLKLAYTSNNFHKYIEVPDINRVADGLYHFLQLTFNPFNLILDGNIIDISNGGNVKEEYISTNDNIYLGGIPADSPNYKEAKNIFHSNFEGCIESFGTNKDNLISDFSNFQGENIGSCSIA